MAYGVSPFFARCAIFWRISIPSFGRPILMPLAFARAIPAFVRSLIFCAYNFPNDESNPSDLSHKFVVQSLIGLSLTVKRDAVRHEALSGAPSFTPYPRG